MIMHIGAPNAKQDIALRAGQRYVGYGGARGGGKSWFVRAKAKILCLYYPGIRVLIVRRTYRELKDNHIDTLKAELVPKFAKYNNADKEFTWINGSKLKFMYCRHDADLQLLQGNEYDVIFVDEATQMSEYQLKTIDASCRGSNSFPKRTYYTCNPGGIGHGYIKRIFISRDYEEGEYPEDYEFIQALVDDNKALMDTQPEYKRSLEKLPPKLRKAWLEGSWDIFEGQFFEDFINNKKHYQDRQYTHVIEPFEIPREWNVYRSYDFGYGKPFSVGWWAVDHDGTVYRILELYGWTGVANEGCKWTPDQQFAKVREIETSHPWLKGRNISGPADPSIWDGSRGESVADTAMKHQVYFTPGDNSRIAGWMQMHYRFQFDDNGYPGIYIFSNCEQFIRTIPLQVYSETNVEDLDTTQEDHVADEARYFLMSRPITPRIPEETKNIPMDDPLNQRVKTFHSRARMERY